MAYFVFFGLCISALLLAGISIAEGIFVTVATVGPYTMFEESHHQNDCFDVRVVYLGKTNSNRRYFLYVIYQKLLWLSLLFSTEDKNWHLMIHVFLHT